MIKPIDIETKDFKKVALGYSTEAVDDFLDDILVDYEMLYTENVELKDKLSILNESVDYYRSMEKTMQNTLALAEKRVQEAKEAAEKEAELIEKKAQNQVSDLLRESQEYLNRVELKISQMEERYELIKRKIRLLLNDELEILNKSNLDTE